MRKFGWLVAVAFALLVLAAPAKADSVLVLNDANGCGGSNCFGNVLTFTIHSNGGGNYHVTLAIDTTGNTNVGSAIAGVTFKFADMTSASLTAAPGGTAGWIVTDATLSANGCATGNHSPACTFDSAFIGTLGSSFATVGLAALPHAGTYTWEWNVHANGTIDVASVRALFGKMDVSTNTTVLTATPSCPSGYSLNQGVCKKVVGTPSKGVCSVGVKDGNDCVLTATPSCPNGYSLNNQGVCTKTVTETTYSYKQTGLISASGTPREEVPEPGSLALFGLGLLGVAGLRRLRP